MTLTEVISKMLTDGQLTDAEKEFLSNYREPDPKDRVPKSRLDQELARRRETEEKVAVLQHKIDELESRDLSDQEKAARQLDTLKQQLGQAQQERDAALGARTELEFRTRVAELAGKNRFTDPDYLGFLAKKQNVDLNDQAAVDGFLTKIRQDCPKFFRIETAGGAGSANEHRPAGGAYAAATASGNIEAMIAAAPRISGNGPAKSA